MIRAYQRVSLDSEMLSGAHNQRINADLKRTGAGLSVVAPQARFR